jgi:hypothetical protein
VVYTPSVAFRPPGTLVLAAIVAAVLAGTLLTLFGPYSELEALAGVEPPEERVAGTAQEIDEFLAVLGESGRAVFARALWWDFLVALLVPAAVALTVMWLVHRLPVVWRFLRWLVLIPAGFAVADVVENVLLLLAVASFPETASPWAATATTVKLTLGLASIPIVAVLGVMSLLLRSGR